MIDKFFCHNKPYCVGGMYLLSAGEFFIDVYRVWHFIVTFLEVPIKEEQFFLVFNGVKMHCGL